MCFSKYICIDSVGMEENCKKEAKMRIGESGRWRRQENGSRSNKNIPDIVE